MTLLSLDKAIVYRAASLRYYATTHSTIGSRTRGGRFNRPGLSALYLALDADTALAEYWEADPPRPLVLVPNELDAAQALDIRPGRPSASIRAGPIGSATGNWRASGSMMVIALPTAPVGGAVTMR